MMDDTGSLPASDKEEGELAAEYDVIVVGGGGGGLPVALFCRWKNLSVLLVEKAAALGGTALKANFHYWVPNNKPMQTMGMVDSKEDCLRYMARVARPQRYNLTAPRLGLTEWEFAMCEAIYQSASVSAEILQAKGALPYCHRTELPDYWAELPEDAANRGRVLAPAGTSELRSDGGLTAIKTLTEAVYRDGVAVLLEHRVIGVVRNTFGEAIGVSASNGEGQVVRFRAKRAVIFSTGGFTHNPELRENFLSYPIMGGCAAVTNEGDFVQIATGLGAPLRNMNNAWLCPIPLEKAIQKDPAMLGAFCATGDSMIWVNVRGRRVVNEKLAYNEIVPTFFQWDAQNARYPNLVLISIWDERSQKHSATDQYGSLIVPPGVSDDHVIRGSTLAELASNLKGRLAKYSAIAGGLELADDFVAELELTIRDFNRFAKLGKDELFHRGERTVELLLNGPVCAQPSGVNPTMYPLSASGPYYAALLTGGALDTKGGPVTNVAGQVLDSRGHPIPGLYGLGNCVAGVTGRGYWGAGGTLGPILAMAHRIGEAVGQEGIKNARLKKCEACSPQLVACQE